ncbi:hypothetical protein MCELHM10_02189 [Paracoccaceae bacterium]
MSAPPKVITATRTVFGLGLKYWQGEPFVMHQS